jgi:hypothetical protein
MLEQHLKRLRNLRDRCAALSQHIKEDLLPFAKTVDGTFRRKPDSYSPDGDVNVTTTCSCLMALALTNELPDFYNHSIRIEDAVTSVFRALVKAPWMSSGLTANNAFTTSLVIRTLGFLKDENLLDLKYRLPDSHPFNKHWELHLGIKNPLSLASTLRERSDPTSRFLWSSISDKTRRLIDTAPDSSASIDDQQIYERRLLEGLALDLRRVIQSGAIFEPSRFPKVSTETRARLDAQPTGYDLAYANHFLLVDEYPDEFNVPAERTIEEIARALAGAPENFSINEYPPSAAVIYWFVDGVTRANIKLHEPHWAGLCRWAAREFNQARSRVVAEHDAMMDPIAMAMAACLCARLKRITADSQPELTKSHLEGLPSAVELERSIAELMSKQAPSGIWPKYFPLFHYQDAGSNFCFTFELLEAILYEFGDADSRLLTQPSFIEGLERAVAWCEGNRQRCIEDKVTYTGWNSGGYLETLMKGQPESWATGVVHMFLRELRSVLSQQIQELVLQKYPVTQNKPHPPVSVAESESTSDPEYGPLDDFLDIDLLLRGQPTTVRSVLRERVIKPNKGHSGASLRRHKIEGARSALLFGPPGTSKTEITKAVAEELGWPLVEITPSEFLQGTLANVYVKADEIFQDLADLSGVVVFFDEMDALVQTRDGDATLDIASQFLTTIMLPKLSRLHDQGRVVFLMATNYQERFDPAIKRSGRFDLLICMGPPNLKEKEEKLYVVFGKRKNLTSVELDQAKKAGERIRTYLASEDDLRDQFELFTFGEYRTIIKNLGKKGNIGDMIEGLTEKDFREIVKRDGEYALLRVQDLRKLHDQLQTKHLSELRGKKVSYEDLKRHKLESAWAARYMSELTQSKDQ